MACFGVMHKNMEIWRLRKFLQPGLGRGESPVTFARYTGQESDTERDIIPKTPPDILLTNFMMLEYLMTRQKPDDQTVVRAADGLRFLVLDELHSYRGRHGADVTMLIRLRERFRRNLNRFWSLIRAFVNDVHSNRISSTEVEV